MELCTACSLPGGQGSPSCCSFTFVISASPSSYTYSAEVLIGNLVSPYLGAQAWAPALGQLYPLTSPPFPSDPPSAPERAASGSGGQVQTPSGDLAKSLCPNRPLAGPRRHSQESSPRTDRARSPSATAFRGSWATLSSSREDVVGLQRQFTARDLPAGRGRRVCR